MANVMTGTQRGHVITLDDDEPGLVGRSSLDGRRVRVVLEPLDEAKSALTGEPTQLLVTWAEKGPHGPIEEQRSFEAPEEADLVLSDEEQIRLLEVWAEEGPQGPIKD